MRTTKLSGKFNESKLENAKISDRFECICTRTLPQTNKKL